MARAALELKARKAAMLLRCQQARELRRRLLSLRADHAVAAALVLEQAARDARDAHSTISRARLAAAYEALPGRIVERSALQDLVAQERQIAHEARAHLDALITAEAETQKAREAASAARAEFKNEARATTKRTRLAASTEKHRRDARESAEVQECDDQLEDARRQ